MVHPPPTTTLIYDAVTRATMSGGSGRAAVLHHPRGSVQVGRDPDTVAFALHAEVPKGHLAVAVHGTPDGFAPGAAVDDVVNAIRKHPDYVEGMPICLYSCHAGANGTGAQLAEKLGSRITAPTTSVHLDFGSTKPYLDPGGVWKDFG